MKVCCQPVKCKFYVKDCWQLVNLVLCEGLLTACKLSCVKVCCQPVKEVKCDKFAVSQQGFLHIAKQI